MRKFIQFENIPSSSRKNGFTLIELLVVMAVLGLLVTVVLVVINPAEQLAKARDAGRISAVTQLGRAVTSFYAGQGENFPLPDSWDQDLITTGFIPSFPAGIPYSPSSGVSNCLTNVKPNDIPSYCYDNDEISVEIGSIVFSKLESKNYTSSCNFIGDTFVVYSFSDERAGLICSVSDPTPWETGTQFYLE